MRSRVSSAHPLVALLAVLLPASVLAQSGPERIRFTHYDPALGLPAFDDVGDVSFSGRITLSGTLRVEREDPALCGGACAYFRPDADSRLRLPRPRPMTGSDPVGAIQLYDAEPLLRMASGRAQARRWLARHAAFEMPVVLTLRNLRIYGACGGMHYEAVVAGVPSARGGITVIGKPRFGSAC